MPQKKEESRAKRFLFTLFEFLFLLAFVFLFAFVTMYHQWRALGVAVLGCLGLASFLMLFDEFLLPLLAVCIAFGGLAIWEFWHGVWPVGAAAAYLAFAISPLPVILDIIPPRKISIS